MNTAFKNRKMKLGVVAHTCNLSTWEAEAGRSPVGGQPGVHSQTLSQTKTEQKQTIANALEKWNS
jgi:hypothetical protein